MIVVRSMDPRWLSNTWLVADRPGGNAVLVDTGAPPEPILAKVRELELTVTHALLTHHHIDHVVHGDRYREACGCLSCGHPRERDLFGALDLELEHGDEVESGGLRVRALHIPGHTRGQLAFLVNEERVFTGDTLFRGSVGGTTGPGHTTCEDLKHSILEVLLRLPPETVVHPGHQGETTVGEELERNPFVRCWRGLDSPSERPCRALGRPATLLLRAADYDGGSKCWVRFEGGDEAVVPGSRVVDA
ncbi:MAG: MBL fold metallo-hydrolase [Planctomycetota bacterium]|nr:MAG: MBL fold metallo-hydrolase [Planctomycetota bacterium]